MTNPKYTHRIYTSDETAAGLERIAAALGLLISRGPSTGTGSRGELLDRLVSATDQLGDDGIARLRQFLQDGSVLPMQDR